MKNNFLIFPIVLFLCSIYFFLQKEATSTEDLMEMEMTGAIRTHTGLFLNGPYGTVSGTAHIVRNTNGSIQLRIENLKASNGPD